MKKERNIRYDEFEVDDKCVSQGFYDYDLEAETQSPTTYYGSYRTFCFECGSDFIEHDFSAGTQVDGNKCKCYF